MDICYEPYAFKCEPKMIKTPALRRRNFRSAGFSVVELVVLVAVISVLGAIGFPLYLSYSRAQETDGAARVIVVSLNQARQLAVTRGISFSVEAQTNPNNRTRFCSGTVVPCPGGRCTRAPGPTPTGGHGSRTDPASPWARRSRSAHWGRRPPRACSVSRIRRPPGRSTSA